MSYICQISSIDPSPAVTLRSHATFEELSEIFESSFARLIAYLEDTGEGISGPPFVIYYGLPAEPFDVEMGLPVTRMVNGNEQITSTTVAIERGASTVHTGPYEEIESAYVALAEWMNENAHEPTGEIYEFYLNDPGTTSPEELQTIIFMPVKTAEKE